MAISLGIDLCDDYTTVCRTGGNGVELIPMVICRDKENKEWHIGQEAYRTALANGVLTDNLLKRLKKEGTSTMYGRTWQAGELLEAFLRSLFAHLAVSPKAVDALCITMTKPDRQLWDAVAKACVRAGIRPECLRIQSHAESFIYYTLSQEKELYSNLVSLFDLSDETLSYYELKVVRGVSRASVIAEGQEMEEAFHIDVLKNESGRKLGDRIMLGLAQRMLEKKIVSAVFLTGRGFESTEWAEEFKEYICRRRRVLAEQGLFARGAANAAEDALREKTEYPYLMFCDARTDFELSMTVVANQRASRLVLVPAGKPWYTYRARAELIPSGQDYIDLELSPVDKFKKKRALRMPLTGFPKRPDKCTRVALSLSMEDAHRMRIHLEDCGFGELFPKSGGPGLTEEITV